MLFYESSPLSNHARFSEQPSPNILGCRPFKETPSEWDIYNIPTRFRFNVKALMGFVLIVFKS
jgi:hypothetical protein